MPNNEEMISIYKEDGTIKSKEDFLNDVANIYDKAAEHEHSHNYSLYDVLCDPEQIIEPKTILDNFDFHFRTIYISNEITPELGTEIVRQIRMWNCIDDFDGIEPEDREPIRIYIDTPGGDIYAVFSIISAIQISITPVHTYTYGCGYSGGFFIGISGHKRIGFPHSSYLFHEGMTLDAGDAHKFLQHTDFYKLQLKKLEDITVNSTKITHEDYESHRKDDWFFSASEALHYGIIDEIAEMI